MLLANLSDEELLSSLTAACFEARRLLGRVLVHLLEVEDRRLDLRSACSSLFDFCQRRLGMSEGEAVRRIEAARLVRRFPTLLGHIEAGHLHLSALHLLRDHLTEGNVEELVAAARGKTKRELEELLAARAPKPDVMATVTELAAPPVGSGTAAGSRSSPPLPAQVAASAGPSARIEPLSASRHRLELTISAETRAKLERARELMGHRAREGRLETVLDRALDALLAKLEKERLGKAARPRPAVRSSKPGYVPRSVRREVFARDGGQCTYTDPEGRRCPSRMRLELDHVVPRACGGSDDAANLRVRCATHNRWWAEESFGKEHVEQAIRLRRRSQRARVNGAGAADTMDVARRALTKMGFRDSEARRALDALDGAHPPDHGGVFAQPPPLHELLRAALGVLA